MTIIKKLFVSAIALTISSIAWAEGEEASSGELAITQICARCQPNVPAAKDLGWILLENVGNQPLELSDYQLYCVNRGKKMKLEEAFTLPTGTLGVGETFKVWTSESPVEALPAEATPLYAKKINQKKYPMVQLYKGGTVTQTVLVPVDLADEDFHTVATDRRPTVSSLYGVKDAPDPWQAFAQAKIGEDYSVTLPILPADMSEANKDQIADVKLIYQIGFGQIQTNETAMVKSAEKDKMNGWTYTGTIPGSELTKAGELVRFAVAITDNEGHTFRAPSFQNKDDGYEWYGTIIEPAEGMTDAKVQTFYLFADEKSLVEMDKDVDKQDKTVVPYNARVGIYDALTRLYYDNVRIDLRGNTTARFPKKSHGLRFSKSQPLSCTDPVTGTVFKEIRKTSFVADYMDPAYIRQSLSFWLFREAGALAPYDYPVKLNLNGEFYQLAWNSNRFTDELIEDVYGLDPLGYAFKNCGTLQPGHSSSITTEKKTPDDENESDIEVEKAFENTLPDRANYETKTDDGENNATYNSVVVRTFDLPAWLNYMAMTRITSETDDTWSNISLYYDSNNTGTWMPLAYDCHLSFGAFFCHDAKEGVRADADYFKSHPFYGGWRVPAHYKGNEEGGWGGDHMMMNKKSASNSGLESIYQSPKFRRLYLRRLRTLMDEILEAPDTAQEDSKIGGYIKLITDATAELAAADRAKWPFEGTFDGKSFNFQGDSMNCWPNVASMTPEDGIEDLWNNYIEPRRVHLFETHSIDNVEKGVGYNNRLSAGIPDKQSAIADLRDGITAEYDMTTGAIVIQNTNEETIDLSNWELSGPVTMTLPAGTILDQSINGTAGELYVTADRKATVTAMEVTDQVVVGNGEAGAIDAKITLTAADGTKVIFDPSPAYNYLRLHSFDGLTATADGDTDEWICLTNLSSEVSLDLEGVVVTFQKMKNGAPDGAPKCSIILGAGMTISAGESIRLDKNDYLDAGWAKITNGDLKFTLLDAGGMPVQNLIFKQEDYPNYYGNGNQGGEYYLEATTFEHDSVTFEEVAYPDPDPTDIYDWANTNVTEKIVFAPGTYNLNNVTFAGGLKLQSGAYTINNNSESINSASSIQGVGASITFAGEGTFKVASEEMTAPLFTAKDLYITEGTFAIDVTAAEANVDRVAAVSLAGKFGLSGEGKLDMELDGNQPCGIELTAKKVNADFTAGAFTATLGGTKPNAFKFKGSDAVTLSGGTMEVEIAGTSAKVLNGGKIVFEDGYVCNVTGDETATDATVFEAGKTLTVNGGTFDISVPGAGSEIFTTTDDPEEEDLTLTINGGTFNLLAGDDCVKSAGNDAAYGEKSVNEKRNVVINGGNFYGVSTGNDVIDSNGDIIITGGNILAYTTAVEEDGNGSTGLDVNEGRFIEVTGGNVIAIGGPKSSFHYEGDLAYTADKLTATDWSGKFVELDGKVGKFNTRVWAKLPTLDVATISLFVFTPGIDPTVAPTVSAETPNVRYATNFHDLYLNLKPHAPVILVR